MESKTGRPELNTSQLDLIVRKLEPFLKRGISVRKACHLANIPHSTVYDYLNKDDMFSDRIEAIKSYRLSLVSDLLSYRLEKISSNIKTIKGIEKALNNPKLKPEIKNNMETIVYRLEPTKDDWKFIEWLATNDKTINESFGIRKDYFYEEKFPLSTILDKLETPEKTDYTKLGSVAKIEFEKLKELAIKMD